MLRATHEVWNYAKLYLNFFYRVEAGVAEAQRSGIELLFIGMSSFCRPRSCASTVEHRVHALVSSAVRMRASALVFLVVTHG